MLSGGRHAFPGERGLRDKLDVRQLLKGQRQFH
jgi:hypothetical protein